MRGARALLLAAGRGRRAGGPKAWRPWAGRTLLEAQLDFFGGLLGAEALSVSIQEAWRARCAALSPRTRWVAADPDEAPLDSLRRLIADAPAARSFVLHVDMPVFDRSVYRTLWATDAAAAVPVYGGRRGHPVLLSLQALAEASRLDPARDRLDAWLHRRGACEVPVACAAVLANGNGAAA